MANSGNPGAAVHVPVLPREVIRFLDLSPGLIVVDGTVGAGGHSSLIRQRILPGGKLIGTDRDPLMLGYAAQVLPEPECELVQASYAELQHVLEQLQIEKVDRVLLDLGLSSDQLADDSRGFSFTAEGPLDLRFDTRRGEPAWQLLEQLNADELGQIFEDYAEERHSRRLARFIKHPKQSPIRTAADFVAAIGEAVPGTGPARKDIVIRLFQALRIAVNQELAQLDEFLTRVLPQVIVTGGKAVIISFHSLEDRLVKQAFRDSTQWQILTPKPITATVAEQRANPRCRTAKLRAAQKI